MIDVETICAASQDYNNDLHFWKETLMGVLRVATQDSNTLETSQIDRNALICCPLTP